MVKLYKDNHSDASYHIASLFVSVVRSKNIISNYYSLLWLWLFDIFMNIIHDIMKWN